MCAFFIIIILFFLPLEFIQCLSSTEAPSGQVVKTEKTKSRGYDVTTE